MFRVVIHCSGEHKYTMYVPTTSVDKAYDILTEVLVNLHVANGGHVEQYIDGMNDWFVIE